MDKASDILIEARRDGDNVHLSVIRSMAPVFPKPTASERSNDLSGSKPAGHSLDRGSG